MERGKIPPGSPAPSSARFPSCAAPRGRNESGQGARQIWNDSPSPSGVLAAKEGQIHKKAWQGRRQNYTGLFWTTSSSTKFKSVSSMNREMCWRRFHHFLIEIFEALPGLFVVAWSGRRLSISWQVIVSQWPGHIFRYVISFTWKEGNREALVVGQHQP